MNLFANCWVTGRVGFPVRIGVGCTGVVFEVYSQLCTARVIKGRQDWFAGLTIILGTVRTSANSLRWNNIMRRVLVVAHRFAVTRQADSFNRRIVVGSEYLFEGIGVKHV